MTKKHQLWFMSHVAPDKRWLTELFIVSSEPSRDSPSGKLSHNLRVNQSRSRSSNSLENRAFFSRLVEHSSTVNRNVTPWLRKSFNWLHVFNSECSWFLCACGPKSRRKTPTRLRLCLRPGIVWTMAPRYLFVGPQQAGERNEQRRYIGEFQVALMM